MGEFPTTRLSLILKLKDSSNRAAWEEFVGLYAPAIYRYARQRGLQEADAQDLAQNVLSAVAKRIPDWKADTSRARFRTWLYRIASNQAVTLYRRRKPDAARGGTTALSALHRHAGDESTDMEWNYRREVFRMLARRARAEFEEVTWQAFWMTAVEGISVSEAACSLERTVGSIYTARSRVIRRLQELACGYDWDPADSEVDCEAIDD